VISGNVSKGTVYVEENKKHEYVLIQMPECTIEVCKKKNTTAIPSALQILSIRE
jgi:hypothetical protein